MEFVGSESCEEWSSEALKWGLLGVEQRSVGAKAARSGAAKRWGLGRRAAKKMNRWEPRFD